MVKNILIVFTDSWFASFNDIFIWERLNTEMSVRSVRFITEPFIRVRMTRFSDGNQKQDLENLKLRVDTFDKQTSESFWILRVEKKVFFIQQLGWIGRNSLLMINRMTVSISKQELSKDDTFDWKYFCLQLKVFTISLWTSRILSGTLMKRFKKCVKYFRKLNELNEENIFDFDFSIVFQEKLGLGCRYNYSVRRFVFHSI